MCTTMQNHAIRSQHSSSIVRSSTSPGTSVSHHWIDTTGGKPSVCMDVARFSTGTAISVGRLGGVGWCFESAIM